MPHRLINYFRGSVRLEITGAFPERFINLCAQRSIPFWDVEWKDQNRLLITVTRLGARQAPDLGERVLCTVTPARQAGMPYFLSRFRRRYALLVGLALALAAVCVLSRFVLTIDVTGNDAVPTAEILSELRRQGLRIGVYGPGLDEAKIGHETLLQLPELSWMSVNLHGTRAEVLVREAVPKPELVDETIFGNIVAEAPGIITHMEVLEGEATYLEGDTVVAGEVLISGNIQIQGPAYSEPMDRGWRQVRAAGRVYARTWRTMTAEIPLQAQVKTYTGAEKTRFSCQLLGLRINFYGNGGISFAGYDKISSTWTATLPGGRVMPLALSRETLREYTLSPMPLERQAAEELLQQRLAIALEQALGDGETVSMSYTADEQDGMLHVTLQAECREEIGRFVPLEGQTPAP